MSVITIRFNEDDEELLKFIEEYSKKNYLSKSAFCKVAIREFMKLNQTEVKSSTQEVEIKEDVKVNKTYKIGGLLND